MEVIEKYQGKQLSANLPYKTQFLIPNEETGKEQKLICHLVGCLLCIFALLTQRMHTQTLAHVIITARSNKLCYVSAGCRGV